MSLGRPQIDPVRKRQMDSQPVPARGIPVQKPVSRVPQQNLPPQHRLCVPL